MKTPLLLTLLAAALALPAPLDSQSATPPPTATAPAASTAKPDYAQEAYVLEEMATKISFDNDGKRTREQTTRVEIKSDAGVQLWGLLAIPYQSATEAVEMGYVRVRKPDGTTIVTPPDNVQDLDSEITRSAPFYSDLREKHVAVKGLGKGDVLEYQVLYHPIKSLIPGEFWFEYNFSHNGIVKDERVEIRVPADRAVKFKGPEATQTVKTEGAERVYSWSYSKLESAKEPAEDEKKKLEAARGQTAHPDIEFSSFQSWEAVGEWYWNLQKDRVEPSAAVRAKAAELTKGLTDDTAKLQALYTFVSMQYRYIGIAFGIGRYQPHEADDVLTNNYGDCKDKHTLLAALAKAVGITIYPALISATGKLDEDVPSPGQFDHIIGYVPQGYVPQGSVPQAKGALWLDTTPEVGPFGYLLPNLRDKPALVMSSEKAAKLETTPADPPFPNKETFKVEGKLNADGSFDGQMEDTARGDAEVPVRAAFRRFSEAQWKDLVQQISYGLGYSGTVSEVKAGAPAVIDGPFHFSYSYNRKDYPDWPNHQFYVPSLPFFMPPVRDDAKDPIWLGSPAEIVAESKVELPTGYYPQVPANVDLVYDFAEYHASYTDDHGALRATRRIVFKQREVAAAKLDEYRSFVKNVGNDVNRYVQTTASATFMAAPVVGVMSGPLPSFPDEIRDLPASTSAEANLVGEDGREKAARGEASPASNDFQRAVRLDPKFTRAWTELAAVELMQMQNDAALDALRNAIDSDPKQIAPHKIYADALMRMKRNDAALQVLQELLKLAPDDHSANSTVGNLLTREKRYAEALPYVEKAASSDSSPSMQIRLGTAYLRAGQADKGTAILQKVLDADSKPEPLNDVAYEMADANVNLDKALEYSKRAVEEQEKESHDLLLSSVMVDDLTCTRQIGSFWDTLGWVYFRLGHLDEAEDYLRAAWLLSQDAAVGEHLGEVYEQKKENEKAIHMYRMALAAPENRSHAEDAAREHLNHLGYKEPATPMEMMRNGNPGGDLSQLRTIKLKHRMKGTATAEIFMVFAPGPKLVDSSFISGSKELKPVLDELPAADFQVAFPAGSTARLLRRGILMCSPISGCDVVMYTPGVVSSVH